MNINAHIFRRIFLLLITVMVANTSYCQQQVKSIPVRIPDGDYRSPDGKYTLTYRLGDAAELDTIRLYSAKSKSKSNLLEIKNLDSISFVWLPKRKHTLVFAVRRTQGKPFIGMWDGSKMKVLIVGNLPPEVDPAAEYFTIVGVTLDGNKVIYTHLDATTPKKEAIVDKTMNLRHGLVLSR